MNNVEGLLKITIVRFFFEKKNKESNNIIVIIKFFQSISLLIYQHNGPRSL